jgi:hypothetical protein
VVREVHRFEARDVEELIVGAALRGRPFLNQLVASEKRVATEGHPYKIPPVIRLVK